MFADATDEVFDSILSAIERGERDDSFLVALFNDEYNSNTILCHFRVSDPYLVSRYGFSFPTGSLEVGRHCSRLTMTDLAFDYSS
jgi:hypothetical protein